MGKKSAIHDCRKINGRMSSLSFSPHADPLTGSVAAHEGTKPNVDDYIVLSAEDGGSALYQAYYVDYCMNVDPANMWLARVKFVPGRTISKKLRRQLDEVIG